MPSLYDECRLRRDVRRPMLVAVAAAFLAAPLAFAQQPKTLAKGHVGAAVCGECHAAAFEAWSRSRHREAMQVADAKTVLGDFRNAKFAYAGTTSVFSTRDGKFFVRTDGPDGKLADFEIKYTFGVDPLQQYLIALPGGRLQALGIAWDARPKAAGGQRWFHLYPGQNLRAGDPLHWTGVNQNWNYMCAECHSTAMRKSFDAEHGTYKSTWSEINVACEACHGPGADHAARARTKRDSKSYETGGDNALVLKLDEREGVAWVPVPTSGNAQRSVARSTSREIDMCGRCHARASRITDNYSHGKSPHGTHRRSRLDEGLYWSDGQVRDEVYEWGAFLQSKMYAAGVTCADCHEPHSQALRRPGNELCAQCHLPAKYDGDAHTHHAKGTPGAACVACHMTTTTFMQIDARHDHSLRVPRPDLSAKLGTPNACNQCHAKKTPQWAADAIRGWTGRAPAGYQNFAEAMDAGTQGAPGARGGLIAIIDDPKQPGIVRASAIDRLGRILSPSSLPTVVRALDSADPLMRQAAVEAIATTDAATRARYLPRLLSDPARSVRIEVARALVGAPEAQIPEADRAMFERTLKEYIGVQKYNADRPENRMNLGNFYAARGDSAHAIEEFRKALEIDPTSVEARVNLADLYRTMGNEPEAQKVLLEGIAKTPRAAALHHALGLSYIRQKRAVDGLRELGEAARLAPENARFAYVYAVALADAGKPNDALKILTAALKQQPWNRDVLFGLAHYSAKAGKREAAQEYAKTLAGLDPENAEYTALARSLSEPVPR